LRQGLIARHLDDTGMEKIVKERKELHFAAPVMTWDAPKRRKTRDRARSVERRTMPRQLPLAIPMIALVVGAFLVRVLMIGDQSAYMDEGTFILTGRTLIEKHAVFFKALDWTYGSYLWSLVAASADILGGLRLVRIVNASFGAVMALATAIVTLRLTPVDAPHARPRTVALVAGLLMALFPTAVGVGRFGTYDAMAGAAFMSGVALLVAYRQTGRWPLLCGAAALVFIGFLAKYVVAIYLPFVCLYLLISARDWRTRIRNFACFILPLGIACLAYFLAFHSPLINLLRFSGSYTDLKSSTPLREYVWQRPELYVLAGLALLAWRRVGRTERVITLGGTAIIIAFQALSRPDFDWWKHSIYPIFFLAPLAAHTIAPPIQDLVQAGWHRGQGMSRRATMFIPVAAAALIPLIGLGLMKATQALSARSDYARIYRTITLLLLLAALLGLLFAPLVDVLRERRGARPLRISWRTIGIALVGLVILPTAVATSLVHADALVTFYPDINPAVGAIRVDTVGAKTVLVDDSVMRYYLYQEIDPEKVVDPFSFTYRGKSDMDAYRQAITDRYFDVIVLDGGIGPLGQRIRKTFGGLIPDYYDRVYTTTDRQGIPIEIYHVRAQVDVADIQVPNGASIYRFDGDLTGWGGQPENADLQPGLQAVRTTDQTWNGHASLRFTPTNQVTLLGVRRMGPVSKVTAQVYIVPTDQAAQEIRIGMMGFDSHWQWHDDGFANVLPTGRWTEITWNLTDPGQFNEIGLKLQPGAVQTLYVGRVEIDP